jgi:hypothetical protein
MYKDFEDMILNASNKTKDIEIAFLNHAKSKGYKYKVVGDNAYSKKQNDPQADIIKMLSAKNNKIQIFETGVGRYEIEINTEEKFDDLYPTMSH